MDLRALEHFVAVAEELNVTRAAVRVHAAQSTVSAALRSLERELGAVLFERTTRSVRLTAAGERVLPAAQAALSAADQMRDLARDRSEGLRGRVRLGTFSGLDPLHLPSVLAAFRARHPGVDVTLGVSPLGSTGLHEDLLRGRLDLAFATLPSGPDVVAHPLVRRPFRAFLHPHHPLARRRRIRLGELAAEDWVDTPPGFGNRTMLDEALARAGVARHLVVEVGDLPSALAFVAAGVGVAVLPDAVPGHECVAVTLADGPPDWQLSLAARRSPPPSAAAQALMDALRTRAAALRPSAIPDGPD